MAVTLATLLWFDPTSAQSAPPFTAEQCGQFRSSIIGILQRYRGKLSAELIADLQEFSRKDCDRTVQIRMMPGTKDRDAVGELKVLMAARQ